MFFTGVLRGNSTLSWKSELLLAWLFAAIEKQVNKKAMSMVVSLFMAFDTPKKCIGS